MSAETTSVVEANKEMSQSIGRAIANQTLIVTTHEKADELLLSPSFM